MTTPQIRRELDGAQHRHEWAQEQAAEYQQLRNEAVRTALDAGWTHAQIADAMGITRGRVGQIAKATRPVLANDV